MIQDRTSIFISLRRWLHCRARKFLVTSIQGLAIALTAMLLAAIVPADAAGLLPHAVASQIAGRSPENADALRRLKDNLAHLTLREHELRQRLGEMHPETTAAMRRVTEVAGQLDAEIDRLVGLADVAMTGTRPALPARQRPDGLFAWSGGIGAGLGLIAVISAIWVVRGRLRRQGEVPSREMATRESVADEFEVSIPRPAESGGMLLAARGALVEPHGEAAAAIGMLRDKLDRRLPQVGERVVVLTSIMAETEQVLLASNLSHAMVGAGERVLLIDAETDEAILTRTLCGDDAGDPSAAEDAILLDQVSGLWFSRGRAGGQPITAARIARMRSVFDTILVAAPALSNRSGRRLVADLAPVVDQIMLVRREARAPIGLARLAVRHLDLDPGKVLHVRARDLGHAPADVQSLSGEHAA